MSGLGLAVETLAVAACAAGVAVAQLPSSDVAGWWDRQRWLHRMIMPDRLLDPRMIEDGAELAPDAGLTILPLAIDSYAAGGSDRGTSAADEPGPAVADPPGGTDAAEPTEPTGSTEPAEPAEPPGRPQEPVAPADPDVPDVPDGGYGGDGATPGGIDVADALDTAGAGDVHIPDVMGDAELDAGIVPSEDWLPSEWLLGDTPGDEVQPETAGDPAEWSEPGYG